MCVRIGFYLYFRHSNFFSLPFPNLCIFLILCLSRYLQVCKCMYVHSIPKLRKKWQKTTESTRLNEKNFPILSLIWCDSFPSLHLWHLIQLNMELYTMGTRSTIWTVLRPNFFNCSYAQLLYKCLGIVSLLLLVLYNFPNGETFIVRGKQKLLPWLVLYK